MLVSPSVLSQVISQHQDFPLVYKLVPAVSPVVQNSTERGKSITMHLNTFRKDFQVAFYYENSEQPYKSESTSFGNTIRLEKRYFHFHLG